MNDDRDIKDLLHETAAGITPRGGYEEIKERAMRENSSRRWVLPSVAAAAAMVLVVGGVGWMLRGEDDPRSTPGPLDTPTVTTSEEPSAEASLTWHVPLYYVGDSAQGSRLFPEVREVTSEGDNPVYGAVRALMAERPRDPDYANPWISVGADLTGAGLSRATGSAQAETIQLSFTEAPRRPAGMTDDQARTALGQLFFTARASTGSETALEDSVNFVVTADNEPVDSLLGIPLVEVLDANPENALAPVQITSLAHGQTVPAGKVTVSGVAAAFEANVQWEIEDATGTAIKEGYTTAEECCRLAPYSFEVDLAPGTYLVIVHDTDESGENRPVNEDTKRIVVE